MKHRILTMITLSLLSTLVLLAGCAGALPPPVQDEPVTTEYKIGPGDTLTIHVRNNPDLSMSVPVRPDGKISIPLVQNMVAAGKAPAVLATDLEQSLTQYIRDPLVTVVVTSFVGIYSDQIRVVGEAASPQSIPYRDGMTLLDVMIEVGGLTRFAAGNSAKLVRKYSGEEKTYGIDVQELLNGNIDKNVPMRPGDVIIIPRSLF